jgi:hypothetical protein
VGSADVAASIRSEGRFEDAKGDRKVSVTMRGRFINFLCARWRVRWVRNGEPADIAEGLRDGCLDVSSEENRSGPADMLLSAKMVCPDTGEFLFIVPSSSSGDSSMSTSIVSTTGCGSGDMDEI